MNDPPGMGDYSPPDEPDYERADEEALIAVIYENVEQCVAGLKELAECEHSTYYKSIGGNPDLNALGDYREGLWWSIYIDARDALAEGVLLEKQRKQQGEQ